MNKKFYLIFWEFNLNEVQWNSMELNQLDSEREIKNKIEYFRLHCNSNKNQIEFREIELE